MQKNSTIPYTRVAYYDLLNILACLGVLFLHHNSLFHHYDPSTSWIRSLFFQVFFYSSVPVFLMLSGATLLEYRKKYSTVTFFKRRYIRVLVPFLFWSAIALLMRCTINPHFLKHPDFISVTNAIFTHKAASEYYFFVWILSFYFLYPVFSLLIDKKSVLWGLVISMFVINSTFVPLANFFHLTGFSKFQIPLPNNFIFVLLGYLLATIKIEKKHRILFYLAGVSGAFFKFFWIYYFTTHTGHLDKSLTGYQVFPSVLMACGIFVYFKDSHLYKISPKILKLLSSASLGIYVIHIIILPYERKFLHLSENSFYWQVLCPFLTYIICLCLTLLIKKLPLLRHIVG